MTLDDEQVEAQARFFESQLTEATGSCVVRAAEVIREANQLPDSDVTEERVSRTLVHLCCEMFWAGVRATVIEGAAQNGTEPNLDQIPLTGDEPGSPAGPLSDGWEWDA